MKRRQTPEQRQRHNEYQREYRRRNPDKAQKWRQGYILRKAAKLLAAEQAAGEADGGH